MVPTFGVPQDQVALAVLQQAVHRALMGGLVAKGATAPLVRILGQAD